MDECVAVAVAEAVAVAVTEAVAEAEAQKITTTTTPGTLGDGPPGRPPGSGSGYFLDSEPRPFCGDEVREESGGRESDSGPIPRAVQAYFRICVFCIFRPGEATHTD